MIRTLRMLLPLVLWAGGCATSNAANRARFEPDATASITVVNEGLHDQCAIVSGRALYEEEVLVGAVILRSKVEHKLTMEGRWTWWDADDFKQESSTDHWSTIFVNPMEEKQVIGRAGQPGAIRGAFELRYHTGITDADN